MTSDVPEGAERGRQLTLVGVAHFPPLGSTSSPFTQFIFISVFAYHPSHSSLSLSLSVLSLAVYPVAPSLSTPAPDRHETLFLRKLTLVSALRFPRGRKSWKFDCPIINERASSDEDDFPDFRTDSRTKRGGKLTKGGRNTGYRIQSLMSGVKSSYFEKRVNGTGCCCVNEERSRTQFPYCSYIGTSSSQLDAWLNATSWLSALFFVVLIGSISGVFLIRQTQRINNDTGRRTYDWAFY